MTALPSLNMALRTAFRAHQTGAFQEVIRALQDHLDDCVKFQPAGMLLINALWRNKQIHLAEILAREVLTRRADDLEVRKILAMIHQHRGQLKELVQTLRHIIVFDPVNTGSYLKLLANQRPITTGTYDRLMSWIFCTDSVNPNVLCALAGHGGAWTLKIDPLSIARRAVLLAPSSAKTMTCLFNTFDKQPANDDASIVWSRWLFAIDPTNEAICLGFARRFAKAGRSDLVLDVLRQAHERIPYSRAIKTELVSALFYSGQHDQLSTYVDFSTKNAELDIEAQAIALMAAGHRTPAIELLKNQLGTQTGIDIRRRLAWILFDDYSFAEASEHSAVLAQPPSDPIEMETYQAFWELGHGNPDVADAHFAEVARLVETNLAENYRFSQSDMMRVSPSFHSALSTNYFEGLAPLRRVGPKVQARSRILLTVDQGYLDQFRDTIVDNLLKTGDLTVHLHVICPRDPGSLILLNATDKLVVTYEEPNLLGWSEPEKRAYFSSIRFVRAWGLMADGEVDQIALVDVDTEWHDGMANLMDYTAPHSLALIHDPSAPPWAKFNATCGVYTSHPDVMNYLHHVARYIWRFLEKRESRWRLDQCALYCSRLHFHRDLNIKLDLRDLSGHLGSILFDTRGETDRSAIIAHSRARADLIRAVADMLEGLGGSNEVICDLLSIKLASAPDDDALRERVGRLKLASGNLRGFLDIMPPGRSNFWNDTRRDDLRVRKRSIDQFLRLNQLYTSERKMQSAPPPHFDPGNQLFKRITTNLRKASVDEEPFTYALLESFFPSEQYRTMAEHITRLPVTWGRYEPYADRGTIARSDLVVDKHWLGVAEILESREFLNWVVWRLRAGHFADLAREAGFDLKPNFKITIDRRNYSLGPHKDHPARFASALFYLPLDAYAEDLGTCIYRRKEPEWIFDNGLHGNFKDFELIRRIPYRPNTGIVFLNMGNAYHGVEVVQRNARRTLLQYTIMLEPVGERGPDPWH
jgi:hypothetical protein